MNIFGGRSVSFLVFGQIEGQHRPRAYHTKTGHGIGVFSDHTLWYKRVFTAWKSLGQASFEDKPIIFVIKTHRRRPSGSGKPQVDVYKPDLDNIVKEALDALVAAGAFNDDNQVIGISATKHDRMPMDTYDDEWAEIELHEYGTTLEE